MTAALFDPLTKAEYYYDYAGDDPIKMLDPSGTFFCDCGSGFGDFAVPPPADESDEENGGSAESVLPSESPSGAA